MSAFLAGLGLDVQRVGLVKMRVVEGNLAMEQFHSALQHWRAPYPTKGTWMRAQTAIRTCDAT